MTQPLIERLEAAGAILVGALNMGEYAYDFTGENVHDGPSRNPHDLSRMSGGSSGGSGSAVGGGLVPLALGSDTNGSIRVPSSLCGIFGLKPTYGRLSRARSRFPSSASLDHLGPFARSTRDLALSYDAMQGRDPDDPVCTGSRRRTRAAVARARRRRPADRGRGRLFQERRVSGSARGGQAGSRRRCRSRARSNLPEAQRARAAAYVITATEGAALHLDRLRKRAQGFRSRRARPPDRGRHDSVGPGRQGAEIPPLVSRRRCWICSRSVDVIIAPATPCTAPSIGQQTFMLDGVELPVRPNLGIFTQPISFIGSAGGRGAGSAQAAADRRADHRSAMAGGYGIARRR